MQIKSEDGSELFSGWINEQKYNEIVSKYGHLNGNTRISKNEIIGKVSDLKVKPQSMECCKNDCEHYGKSIKACVQPLCIDLAIHNDLICAACDGKGKIRNNKIGSPEKPGYTFHKKTCPDCKGSGLNFKRGD